MDSRSYLPLHPRGIHPNVPHACRGTRHQCRRQLCSPDCLEGQKQHAPLSELDCHFRRHSAIWDLRGVRGTHLSRDLDLTSSNLARDRSALRRLTTNSRWIKSKGYQCWRECRLTHQNVSRGKRGKLNGQWIVLWGDEIKGWVFPQDGLTILFYSVLMAKALPAMADFASKVFCRVGARTHEEDTTLSCGDFP